MHALSQHVDTVGVRRPYRACRRRSFGPSHAVMIPDWRQLYAFAEVIGRKVPANIGDCVHISRVYVLLGLGQQAETPKHRRLRAFAICVRLRQGYRLEGGPKHRLLRTSQACACCRRGRGRATTRLMAWTRGRTALTCARRGRGGPLRPGQNSKRSRRPGSYQRDSHPA